MRLPVRDHNIFVKGTECAGFRGEILLDPDFDRLQFQRQQGAFNLTKLRLGDLYRPTWLRIEQRFQPPRNLEPTFYKDAQSDEAQNAQKPDQLAPSG